MTDQGQQFLDAIRQQFLDIFLQSKAGQDTSAAKHRAQGFIHAGELLGLCQREQLNELMEQCHLQVFGCRIAERAPSLRAQRQSALAAGDYQYFDEPALLRQP